MLHRGFAIVSPRCSFLGHNCHLSFPVAIWSCSAKHVPNFSLLDAERMTALNYAIQAFPALQKVTQSTCLQVLWSMHLDQPLPDCPYYMLDGLWCPVQSHNSCGYDGDPVVVSCLHLADRIRRIYPRHMEYNLGKPMTYTYCVQHAAPASAMTRIRGAEAKSVKLASQSAPNSPTIVAPSGHTSLKCQSK